MLVCDDVLHWAETYAGAPFHALGATLTKLGIIAPFSFHVADMAQRDQISEQIRFCRIGEVSKANDMMHIKLLPILLLCDAAILARVVVTLTHCTLLCSPIRAVVRFITATPRRVVRATIPFISALRRTKAEFAGRRKLAARYRDGLLALFARKRDWWLAQLVLAALCGGLTALSPFVCQHIRLLRFAPNNSERTAFIQTFPRTDRRVFGISNAMSLRHKSFLTDRAHQGLAFIAATRAQRIGTLT